MDYRDSAGEYESTLETDGGEVHSVVSVLDAGELYT
jgi:hypothetical protein